MDKFDQFLNLLDKDNDEYNKSYSQILQSLVAIPKAYLFFYENLPDKIKNYIIKNKKYYADQFFYVIKELDNDTFNKYFFKDNFLDLDKLISIETIRLAATEKLDNQQLQDFIRVQDKPKSLDKLIETLAQLYFRDKTRYNELKKQYKEDLLKINKIHSEKSRAITYLERWISHVANTECVSHALELLDNLNINFELVFSENKKQIGLNSIKKEDLEGFDILFKRNPNKNKYELLRKYIGSEFSNPLYMLEKIEKISQENYVKYWEIFEEYLFYQKENNSFFDIVLKNKEKQWEKEIVTGSDLFIAYFSEEKFRKYHSVYTIDKENRAIEIMREIEKKLLNYKLSDNLESKPQKSKMKI